MEKLTPKLKLVYDCISSATTPLGAYVILDQLRSQGFRAPSQMYRALNGLIKLGLIHKVESLNAFVACAQSHQTGTCVLAICDSCGSVEELPAVEFVDQVQALGAKHAFKSRELAVELKGQCAHCS